MTECGGKRQIPMSKLKSRTPGDKKQKEGENDFFGFVFVICNNTMKEWRVSLGRRFAATVAFYQMATFTGHDTICLPW